MRFLTLVGLFLLGCLVATHATTSTHSVMELEDVAEHSNSHALVEADAEAEVDVDVDAEAEAEAEIDAELDADAEAEMEAEVDVDMEAEAEAEADAAAEVAILPGNTPRVFNYQFAKDLMKLAAISSCPNAAISSWNCLLCKYPATSGMTNVVVATSTSLNTLAYVGLMPVVDNTNKQKPITSKAIVIVFRGTRFDSIVNWALNAKFDHDPFPGLASDIKVHSGFLKDYNSLSAVVLKQVAALNKNCPTCRIIITGHSLGGALATIAAADLIVKGYTPSRFTLYTFGSPRVGNTPFMNFLNSKVTDSFRITHANDPVVHVPPRKLGIGSLVTFLEYQHVGTNYHFPNPFKFSNDNTNLKNCGLTETNVACQSKAIANIKLAITYHLTYMAIDCGCSSATLSQYKFRQLGQKDERSLAPVVSDEQVGNYLRFIGALSGVAVENKSNEQLAQELSHIQFD